MDPLFGAVVKNFDPNFPPPRAVVEEEDGALRVVVPSLVSVVTRVFCSVWLTGVTIGLVTFVIVVLVNGVPGAPAQDAVTPWIFVAGAACFVPIFASMAYGLLWNLFGCEEIALNHEDLTVARFIGKRRVMFRTVPRVSIKHLIGPPPLTVPSALLRDRTQGGVMGYGWGDIRVLTTGPTLRFGLSLNHAEAHRIVDLSNALLVRFAEQER